MRGRGIVGNDTYRMATAEGLDIEESENLLVLEELQRRDISYIATNEACQ